MNSGRSRNPRVIASVVSVGREWLEVGLEESVSTKFDL